VPGQRRTQGRERKQRAFAPRRILRERSESIQVAERSLLRERARDQAREVSFELRKRDGVEIDRTLAEHRRARAHQRAGLAAEAQIGNTTVGYAHIHVQRVAAQGVGAIGRMRRVFECAKAPRRAAVFEHELMVRRRCCHAQSVTRCRQRAHGGVSYANHSPEINMSAINRQFRLAARPVGLPKRSDFNLVEDPVPVPGDGEFVVRNAYISLDPAMRGWMNEGKSYVPPVGLGEVMRAYAAGEVVASKHEKFPIGSHVAGVFGVQEYALSNGKGAHLADAKLAPLPVYLSALGMTGMTAYFGLLDVGAAQAGDSVVVSAAAGAVGSLVGQIAKIKGCRVVGIAGGADKCRMLLDDYGFDAAIDYKHDDVKDALKKHCPQGINVYFDNVGGDILDAALSQLALHARVVICGAISQYNSTSGVKGPANYLALLVCRARMQGMVVFDYASRYGEAARDLGIWLAQGKLKSREDIVEGFDTFPETLLKLFRGENMGKLILKV